MEEKMWLYFTFRSGQEVQPALALTLRHVGEIAKSRGTERAARRGHSLRVPVRRSHVGPRVPYAAHPLLALDRHASVLQ